MDESEWGAYGGCEVGCARYVVDHVGFAFMRNVHMVDMYHSSSVVFLCRDVCTRWMCRGQFSMQQSDT